MELTIRTREEGAGRWVAMIEGMPETVSRGSTPAEVVVRAKAEALSVLAEKIRRNEADEAVDRVLLPVRRRAACTRPFVGT